MIMKPLDGYGGSGVIVIEKSAIHNIKSLLEFYIDRGDGKSSYVILQDYVEGAENGDVRVLMLNGKPIGAIRRRPSKGDARSNISAGGTVEKYRLTKSDKILCAKIGNKLVRDGIYYAGLDLIGGKLIEVNVLSPGTITDINKLNNVKLQSKILDYLEDVVLQRNRLKEAFRPENIITDATT
jgi:glutathione synthase